jgi:death-on-curing family protein
MISRSSQKINYLSSRKAPLLLYAAVQELYGQIPNHPLPDYSREDNGAVAGVLEIIQNDDYYPDLLDKAAHLFAHLITSHIFSNGNKRLGFITTILFLAANGLALKPGSGKGLRELAQELADNAATGRGDYNVAKTKCRDFFEKNLSASRA